MVSQGIDGSGDGGYSPYTGASASSGRVRKKQKKNFE